MFSDTKISRSDVKSPSSSGGSNPSQSNHQSLFWWSDHSGYGTLWQAYKNDGTSPLFKKDKSAISMDQSWIPRPKWSCMICFLGYSIFRTVFIHPEENAKTKQLLSIWFHEETFQTTSCWLPSGKLLHNYGKSPCHENGKTHYFNGHVQQLC